MLDLIENKITTLRSMQQERSGHASVVFGGVVFVAGGQTVAKKKEIMIRSMEK